MKENDLGAQSATADESARSASDSAAAPHAEPPAWERPWAIPVIDEHLCEDWLDAWLAMQLCDVMSRRHYGAPFLMLSIEDRTILRSECEAFVARQTWIQRKRDRMVSR